MRILVPLDDSMQAQRVLRYARFLAAASHGRIKLVRATDVEDNTSFNSLAANAARIEDEGISVEWSVVGGVDARTAILNEAAAWQPDLIAMASMTTSALDRWLNGSVTDEIIRAATVPVLVVAPNWEPSDQLEEFARLLVPLDGSSFAEQTLGPLVRLAILLPAQLILLRAVSVDSAVNGAEKYLRRISDRLELVLPEGRVSSRVVRGSPAAAITRAALDLDVQAIAMATRGRSGLARAVSGSTATSVLQQSEVPLLLLGPHAVVARAAALIQLRAQVRTRDNQHVGEVHRVVADLEQHAVASIVVLGRDRLARDVLVPVDFIEKLDDRGVELRLTAEEVDALPDFSYHEFVTPPSTWTSVPAPATEQQRIGPHQVAVTPETRMLAIDGLLGRVDAIELDLETGELKAFDIRQMRIPAEYVQASDEEDTLRVAAKLADIDGFLGT
jgi:nucleotide-binding universal stress UspA family protein/sporulation protein YlmC with PRC-barrel domain